MISGRPLSQYILPYMVLSLSAFICYFPALSGEFILDDRPFIQNNPNIRKTPSFPSLLMQEDGINDPSDIKGYHTGYYRPLLTLSYWLDYKCWGMHAPGFRLTNLILHLLCGLLILHFLAFFLEDRFAVFLGAFFFLLHPVNTESVSYLTSRNNILVTLFSLLCIICHIKAGETARSGFALRAASVAAFTLAAFSKEFALMILPIMFLYQRMIATDEIEYRREGLLYIPLLVVAGIYFMLRQRVTGAFFTPHAVNDLFENLLLVPYLIVSNLKLIVLPQGLHSFVIRHPGEGAYWGLLIFLTALVLAGIAIRKEPRRRMVLFSVLSFCVALFPVLHIIPTSAVSLISMRWLYFPMPFLLPVIFLYVQRGLRYNRTLLMAVSFPIFLYLGGYTYALNKYLWHDENRFFRLEVQGFENYFYSGGLAEKLFEQKAYGNAEKYFRLAIEHYPDTVRHYLRYAALLVEINRPEGAIENLRRVQHATMSRSERGGWFNNMGLALFKNGHPDSALENLKRAVSVSPETAGFWANLGAVYGAKGNYRQAVDVLRRGLALHPDSIQLKVNLAVSYIHLKDCHRAVSIIHTIPAKERKRARDLVNVLRKNCNAGPE
jgi:tetratricopeptide (TPR) repeat protein